MKRLLCIFAIVVIAVPGLFAQEVTESPVSYAFWLRQDGDYEATLKYKFSYLDEKYTTNLRLIRGSDNAFLIGDKIVMQTKHDGELVFAVETEEQLEKAMTGYITFETSVQDIIALQKGVKSISLLRDGTKYTLNTEKNWNNETRSSARQISVNANKADKIKETKKLVQAKREVIAAKREAQKELVKLGEPPVNYGRFYFGYAPYNISHLDAELERICMCLHL